MADPIHLPAAAIGAPQVILRSVELARGMNSDDIARKRRQREWIGLRPGAYVHAAAFRAIDDVQRHLLLIDATLPKLSEGAVISHHSAACVYGVTLWQPNLRTVKVTRTGSGGAHRRRSLHTTRSALGPGEVVLQRGYLVTSPERTTVDILRTSSFDAAVVAADSARRLQLVTTQSLTAAADRAKQRPGIRQARQVIAFADPRSESVGESLSRVAIFRAGLPAPTLQLPVRSGAGQTLGRCDFGWEEYRTVGEFDGAVKYGRLLRTGEHPGDVVYREKLREDAIRDAGWQVARWTWDDLKDPDAIADKLRRAFVRGKR
jgi:hypothetical protein